MRKRITPILFALLLAAGPAVAQFEGVLETKMTMATQDGQTVGSGGNMTVSVGKAGTRSEVSSQMGSMVMKMVMLQRNDAPDVLYQINDGNKTYTEINLANMQKSAGQQPDTHQYTVEKLGQETILGYKTLHVLVKEKGTGADPAVTTELWAAKDLLDYETFSKLQARRGKAAGQEAFVKALKDAGADGLPLKSITTNTDGNKVMLEVVKVDKKALPASTFEIPAGYTKAQSGMMGGMGGVPAPQADELKKRMDDAMKNMTPEQRKMMEDMMKQRKAPGQQ